MLFWHSGQRAEALHVLNGMPFMQVGDCLVAVWFQMSD